jgi:hypothetical protein
MGLIPLKVWGAMGLWLTVIGLLFVTPTLRWVSHPLMCESGYNLRISWHKLWTVGHIQIQLPTATQGCASYEYDPRNTKP